MHNYAPAFQYTIEALLGRKPEDVAAKAGADYNPGTQSFHVVSFGQPVTIQTPEYKVTFGDTDNILILEWRLVLLHYLLNADGTPLSGELAHFRSMPGGNSYEEPFQNRSVNFLAGAICNKPVANIQEVCAQLGGRLEKSSADVQAVFDLAPRFPVTLQIWRTDDEMKGSASILFDKRAPHYLPTEDMAVTASLVARFMVKQYKAMFPNG